VPTWRAAGGRVFGLGGGHWLLATTSALRVEGAKSLQPLRPAAPDSPCGVLGATRPAQPDFDLTSFEHRDHCITVTIRRAGVAPTREVLAAVYARPEPASEDALRQRLRDRPPAAIATMNQFARIAGEPTAWLVGEQGALAGWLVMRARLRNGADEVDVGLPWSTCALARQGAALAGLAPECRGL